jgi:Fe-S oxidoreductase
VLTGPLNIAARPDRAVGVLVPLNVETVEETGEIGVSRLDQFTRQQLMSLDACMECGRCEEACPATASGKPLSPKQLVVDLRAAMDGDLSRNVHGDVIAPETLWSCTMCQACVQECPVLIGQVDLISDMRRHLVGESQIAGPPAKAMANIGKQGNPHGRPAGARLDWADGLNVPTVTENPDFEYLLWVGCAAAFDPRAQRIARSLVQLMQQANVNFAVLGREERCTGDPARRLGDEFLFQEMARTNVTQLQARQVKKIVTPCPHCLNSLKHEYPQFGGRFEVKHHTQFLSELVRDERLSIRIQDRDDITLHDPCYLARGDGETEAPRALLRAASGKSVREMPRHGPKTFCCGAGGGRMWFDEPVAQRVSHLRAREASATGAKTLATACPFCVNMMSDAVEGSQSTQDLKVMDVAEILWEQAKGASKDSF